MMPTTASKRFGALYGEVEKFIAEKDLESQNKPCEAIEQARLLLIAIENAKNIFEKHCKDTGEMWSKEGQFERMIECLKLPDSDYCRLQLLPQIQLSISSGTSKGWVPKLNSVFPPYVIPKAGLMVINFFGRFKYADRKRLGYVEEYTPTLKVDEKIFKASYASENSLTFHVSFEKDPPVFNAERCTSLKGRLIVPYETSYIPYVRNVIETFEFDVLIRTYPARVGVGTFSYKIEDEVIKDDIEVSWKNENQVSCKDGVFESFVFTAFDGQTKTFTEAGIGPYIELKRDVVNPTNEFKWVITPIYPKDIINCNF